MAYELNIDISTYLRIERDEIKLTEERTEIILKTLGVTRDFVLQLNSLITSQNKD